MHRSVIIFFLLSTLTSVYSQRTVKVVLGDSLTKQCIRLKMTLTKDSVRAELEGPKSQWLAIGFNSKRMQRGVDVLVVPAWKDAAGSLDAVAYDGVLTGYAPPMRDASQHWKVLQEQVVGEKRTVYLVRALQTGDLEDYDFTVLSTSGGSLDIIWAMGSEKGNKTEYHGNQKGKRVLNF